MPGEVEGGVPQQELEGNLEASSQEEIVTGLLGGKPVDFTYNEHYGVHLHFKTDGTTEVEDEGKEYTLQRGERTSSVADFVDGVWTVVDKMKEVVPSIPEGNLKENFGGEQGLAKSFLAVESANRYLEYSKKEEDGKE